MKRKTLKFFACAALMAMTLSVTACGSSDKGDKPGTEAAAGDETDAADKADDSADAADADNAADKADDSADAAGADDAADKTDGSTDAADSSATGTTLEELFNDPTAKSAFDSITQAMTSQGMSASVSAVGNEMIVEVKIEDSSLVVDGVAESLKAALDAQADTFKAQVKTLDTTVGQEGACTFTVRYLDPDGNVLAEGSFKAE